MWKTFGRYHYLNTELSKSANCFCAFIENRPIAFFAVVHFPHPREKRFKRGHRLVVLPDYQGIGIGHALSTFVANYYKELEFRFIITSSTRSLFNQRSKDRRWAVTFAGHMNAHSGTIDIGSGSAKRLVYSYEYIG